VGAVSEEVVLAMAQGALDHSLANIAIAVTGIAGPGGGSDLKPVGLVWFGLARRGAKPHAEAIIFPGDRTEVRCATVFRAIQLMQQAVDLAHRV
jgi:nicotinamide-nucleotide amidase